MADQDEPKVRYPKQEVAKGQKHGYIGDVEVYEPAHNEAGYSNTKSTNSTARDAAPEETAIVGETGLVGGKVDNVAPKKG